MKRRKFLGTSIASALTVSATPLLANGISKDKQKLFRIVHVTDMHIFPAPKVEEGMNALVNEINALSEKPDFILNTGDNVMDSLKRSKEDVQKQWDAWQKYFRDKIKFPLYSCIGNHDVWGWGLTDKSVKDDPLYGKSWALQKLELKKRYYSFDHKGWKFICLDSPYYTGTNHAYTAKLDEEQFAWLESELKSTDVDTPICIVSHIPVLAASVFFDGDNAKTGDWNIPGAWMHIDASRIKDLFYKHKNVRAALSGHVHLADKTEYLSVNYHCNGAVCGGWWKGAYQEFEPAYAVVDFFSDGSISTKLIPYNK